MEQVGRLDIPESKSAKSPHTRTRYDGIQVLRFLAASLVVLHHALLESAAKSAGTPNVGWLNGAAGVDLFFVISGFVMGLTDLTGNADVSDAMRFLCKRFLRIAPLYYLFSSIKVIQGGVGARLSSTPFPYTLWQIVATYCFLPARDPKGMVFPILFIGWTLNQEMFFYCLFALAIALQIERLRFLTPVLIGLSCLSFLLPDTLTFTTTISSMLLEFLFGLLLSRLAMRKTLPGPWLSVLLCSVGLPLLLMLPGPPLSHVGHDYLRPLRWGLPAFAVVIAAVSVCEAVAKRIPRWMILMGDASYAVYLLHPFLLHVNQTIASKLTNEKASARFLMIGLELSSSLLGGLLVHKVVEKPLMTKSTGTMAKVLRPIGDGTRGTVVFAPRTRRRAKPL